MSFCFRSAIMAKLLHDHIAGELAELHCDLVEEGRIRPGAVQIYVGMTNEQRIDSLGLVGRDVVTDDLVLSRLRLVGQGFRQKYCNPWVGMPTGGLATHPVSLICGRRRKEAGFRGGNS